MAYRTNEVWKMLEACSAGLAVVVSVLGEESVSNRCRPNLGGYLGRSQTMAHTSEKSFNRTDYPLRNP
jgi:hypothetical protein